ncbi:MAG: penicillin-binding protein 2 [bacterium]
MYLRNKHRNIIYNEYHSGKSKEQGWRILPIYFVTIAVFGFIFFNLFQLQVIKGDEYLIKATVTGTINKVDLPPRGLIFDRNGVKLASNIPSYTLYLDPTQLKAEDELTVLNNIATVFKIDQQALNNNYHDLVYKNEKKIAAQKVTVLKDIDFNKYIDSIGAIRELPGVFIEVEAVRTYNDGNYFAHVIGYTGDPSQEDIDQGIYSKASVGKSGIEKSYDQELRGIPGIEVISSAAGIADKSYQTKAMQYGNNLTLTIDSRWQEKLTDIMASEAEKVKAYGGAAVIMDSDTGEVVALVSIPNFDNNLFVNGISYTNYNELVNDPKKPQMNRVIGAQLPPGSIFKVIGATTGLETGTINKSTEYLSNRCMELPGKIQFCEANKAYIGSVNVVAALSRSSNIFFCNVALNLQNKGGIAELDKYASDYGIGVLTGIDLPGEQKGTMATPDLKEKLWKQPWYIGDTCNAIIGQGFVAVTPLQMTVVAATINNQGKVLQPRLVKEISNDQGVLIKTIEPQVIRDLAIKDSTFQIIKEGMHQAAKTGTARKLADLPNNIIAKTGSAETCEQINGKPYCGAHSWVMGCFDASGKNYCFTVLHQWGNWGYNSVPSIQKFINCINKDFATSCENI